MRRARTFQKGEEGKNLSHEGENYVMMSVYEEDHILVRKEW